MKLLVDLLLLLLLLLLTRRTDEHQLFKINHKTTGVGASVRAHAPRAAADHAFAVGNAVGAPQGLEQKGDEEGRAHPADREAAEQRLGP